MHTDFNLENVTSYHNFEIDSNDAQDYIRPEGSRYNSNTDKVSERETLILAHIFDSCAIDPFTEDED